MIMHHDFNILNTNLFHNFKIFIVQPYIVPRGLIISNDKVERLTNLMLCMRNPFGTQE